MMCEMLMRVEMRRDDMRWSELNRSELTRPGGRDERTTTTLDRSELATSPHGQSRHITTCTHITTWTSVVDILPSPPAPRYWPP
jgi:hypothetical protein